MQKIDLKLLITALKSIGFTVLATLVLATLHWTGAFPVEAGSWRFLLMLVGFFIVHWIVRVALVTYQSDKAEATRKSKAVMWGAAAAATLLLFMLIFVLLYVISPNDFFVVDPLNFFVGFAIIAGIIVLAHIIDYIVRITIRTVKYGDQIPDYKEGQKIANGDFGGQGRHPKGFHCPGPGDAPQPQRQSADCSRISISCDGSSVSFFLNHTISSDLLSYPVYEGIVRLP